MKKNVMLTMSVAFACLLIGRTAWAEDDKDEKTEKHETAQGTKVNGETLEDVKVTLAQGLAASAKVGKSISGKFELDGGKLQLSVYTMKDAKFSEVVIDHKTGKVTKTEAITSGEDLAAAKAQSEAMAKAKITLGAAVRRALKANKGYNAISVMPTIKDGHPIAEVSIGQEEEVKTISEKLD